MGQRAPSAPDAYFLYRRIGKTSEVSPDVSTDSLFSSWENATSANRIRTMTRVIPSQPGLMPVFGFSVFIIFHRWVTRSTSDMLVMPFMTFLMPSIRRVSMFCFKASFLIWFES